VKNYLDKGLEKMLFKPMNDYYAGFKIILAIGHRVCKPLSILIHQELPNVILKCIDDMLFELKKGEY
jgi:hypothetical protein